ncbi:MAG: DUF72 domain-containing protein [Pseudomonadota bacterium]|uniref:DUF72 domain-containing protein n=1 Tax=Phenylobacterium sp. TaxID=1871053 RepID=UPI0025DE34C1|nr:DUF72 domain-containing protein [Phenylobacterium sp.]MBT9472677.1 DUF72 domain-containing protein [Phenylobacterium sp.]
MAQAGLIRTGIGGWIFEPWRGVFYPEGLKQSEELAYASRHLKTLEINSTYYSSQKPETFAKWAASTPDGFVFSVKASRFCTNRRVLAEAGESVGKFLNQGVAELGDRLGPINWQFMATKKFDPEDFAAFLDLLPKKLDGLALRHVVEVRHPSFADPAFVKLCRNHDVAICVAEHETHPLIADITTGFVYLRLMKGVDEIETAYPPAELDAWAERLTDYAKGQVPGDLKPLDRTGPAEGPREVFAYVIHEGKVRAPAAAQALDARVNK